MKRTMNAAGIALLHEFEDFIGHAYPDPYSPLGKELQRRGLWRRFLREPSAVPAAIAHLSGAPWTIGYGFTEGVREGMLMSRADADFRLERELRPRIDGVLQACDVEPTDDQLAAMVCLAYNIGLGWTGSKTKGSKDGFRQSTVLRCHNRGDFAAASRAFRLWNKAGGVESEGLNRRRAAEAALYMRGTTARPAMRTGDVPDFESSDLQGLEAAPEAPPQKVDGESRMGESPINRAAIGAGATAGLSAVAEVARTTADVKYSADSLGPWLVPLLLVAVVGLCCYIVWTRYKQRKGGWS